MYMRDWRSDVCSSDLKVADLDCLVTEVARWRQAGLKVGFTNGCFDLLHPGHVALLEQARAACDRLIVGLNSDASVRRLKGAARPVQGEAARAAVLGSLASVNRVVIFGDDTPLAVIAALRPDVLDRKSVVEGKGVSVSLDLGGALTAKKKN